MLSTQWSKYPKCPIMPCNPDKQFQTTLTTELKLIAHEALPIKTFQSFEVDPLAAITATLAKFTSEEEAWIQLVIRPAPSNWHKKSERYIADIKRSGGVKMTGLFSILWSPPEVKDTTNKVAEYDQVRASGAEAKSQKLAFEAALRIVYRGNCRNPSSQAANAVDHCQLQAV